MTDKMDSKTIKRLLELKETIKTQTAEVKEIEKSIKSKGTFVTEGFEVDVSMVNELDAKKALDYVKENGLESKFTETKLKTAEVRNYIELVEEPEVFNTYLIPKYQKIKIRKVENVQDSSVSNEELDILEDNGLLD